MIDCLIEALCRMMGTTAERSVQILQAEQLGGADDWDDCAHDAAAILVADSDAPRTKDIINA